MSMIRCTFVLLGMLTCQFWAPAWGAETGAFVMRSRDVAHAPPGAKERPLRALTRLGPGDRLRLGADGAVELIYLGGAGQETWQGKAYIEVGESQSRPLSPAKPFKVKPLPPDLVAALITSLVPNANANAKSQSQPRRAMVRVRSIGPDAPVATAQARYADLRAQSEAEDPTPELYLLGTLESLEAYGDMSGPLEALGRMQRENPAVAEVIRRYQELMKKGRGENPAR